MNFLTSNSAPALRARPSLPVGTLGAVGLGALAAAAVVVSAPISPLLPLGVAAALCVAAIGLSRPMLALTLAIALVPFELVSVDFAGAFGVTPTEAMFVVAGGGFLGRQLIARRVLAPMTALGPPLALLVFANVPGLFIAADVGAVAKQLVMWTAFFFVFQLVVAEGNRRTVRDLLLALVFAGGVVGAVAVADGGTGTPGIGPDSLEGRAVGSFAHPANLGIFLALAIPVQLALMLRGPARLRPAAGLAFVLAMLGLVLSLSRGALLGVAATFTALLIWAPVRRAAAVVLVAIFVLSFIGFNPAGGVVNTGAVADRITQLGDASSNPTSLRRKLYRETPAMIGDHALFGVGADNYPQVAPEYGLVGFGVPIGHAHNMVLGITSELGLVGLAALVWFVVALVPLLTRLCREERGVERAMAFGITGSFVALAIGGLPDYPLSTNAITGTVFALAGCAAALSRALPSRAAQPAAGSERRAPDVTPPGPRVKPSDAPA